MNVYLCKCCSKIISNDLCFIEENSNFIDVGGVEDRISVVPTNDPEVYCLKCECNNEVGEGYKKGADGNQRQTNKVKSGADKNQRLIYKLRKISIIRFPIKKLVGHVRGNPEECDTDNRMNNGIVPANVNKDIKGLTAKVEKFEKELTSIKKEYSEKIESMCAVVGDNMASLIRLAELLCALNPEMDLKSALQSIF